MHACCVWIRMVHLLPGSKVCVSQYLYSYLREQATHCMPPSYGGLCTWSQSKLACSQSLIKMVLLWSIRAAAGNGSSNSQCHLQMQHLGFHASCHRAKIEIGIGSRHEMGQGHAHARTQTMQVAVPLIYKRGLFKQWRRGWTVAFGAWE